MRALGLDIGEKTIGVAVTDELGITAHGVTVIRRKGGLHDLEALARVARETGADRLVYGYPLQEDGQEGPSARRARIFAEKAGAHLGLPIEPHDESHSTVAAEAALLEADVSRKKRKQVIDQVAAVVILRDWLACREATRPEEDET
ncbi:MAG: Holliday junction resolvase RuvX [Deltaproteobacteria bacterium]|nr:Holliday junction resolvase RuvX [Deltaproteobacteria bacterium]